MRPHNEKHLWTLEDFQAWIAKYRKDAARLRKRAETKDQEAERLRQQAAQFSTDKLPLFSPKDSSSTSNGAGKSGPDLLSTSPPCQTEQPFTLSILSTGAPSK